MADKWSDIVENGKSGRSAVVDVNMWLGRATLDAYVPDVYKLRTTPMS